MNHNPTSRSADGRGFTLVEVVMSTLLVSLLMIGSLTLLAHKARSDRRISADQEGHALARQLISEIMQVAYKDPDQTPVFGSEDGPSNPRALWDDVDDYNGLSDAPPKRKDGTVIAGYTGWTRSVTVQYADTVSLLPAGTSTDSGLKWIHVRVTDPAGGITDLKALRSSMGNFDHETPYGRAYISRVAAELQIGADSEARIVNAATTLNEPSSSAGNLLLNADFEDGTSKWKSWNCGLGQTGASHAGSIAVVVGSRNTIDATCFQDITARVENGKSYYVEAWARTPSGSNKVTLSIKTIDSVVGALGDDTQSFDVGTSWTKVSGVLRASWSGTLEEARLRAFTYPDGHTGDIWIDDVYMVQLD